MYRIDFDRSSHVYFIGIGGISMSGLAQILLDRGFRVSGSDRSESDLTRQLEKEGATIYYGQRADNIQEDIDLIVYTAAIRKDNPEIIRAEELGIEMITRAELLGQLMKNYEIPIAIAGMHGKTTTTSMASVVLMNAGYDPTITVGGILKEIGGNIKIGGTKYFVAEACEYTNSFLSFFPKIGIILNIEEEHMDFFKDIDDIYSSFGKFAKLIPEDGVLIINKDIPDYGKIVGNLKCKVITISLNDVSADHYAKSINHKAQDGISFIAKGIDYEEEYKLRVLGEHNILDALAVIALSKELGVTPEMIKMGLESFEGADRRFQFKGRLKGIPIIDDYAHHPTEIRATLSAAKDYPAERIVCVFQPHTYSRTKNFFDDFVEVLQMADMVVLTDIYAAREKDNLGVSSEMLCEAINNAGTECHYYPSFDEVENFLLQNCMHGDVLITMGAGDVVRIGEKLLGI